MLSRFPVPSDFLPITTLLLLPLLSSFVASPAVASGSLLDSVLAAAQNAPQKLYEGKAKPYPAGVMTPEVLKSCLILAHRIDTVGADIAKEKANIQELDGMIATAGPRLQNQAVAALTDPERRKAYEEQVSDYNSWVGRRSQAVDRHNKEVKHFSELSGRFNGECNGRSYYPSDLAIVKSDLPPVIAARVE